MPARPATVKNVMDMDKGCAISPSITELKDWIKMDPGTGSYDKEIELMYFLRSVDREMHGLYYKGTPNCDELSWSRWFDTKKALEDAIANGEVDKKGSCSSYYDDLELNFFRRKRTKWCATNISEMSLLNMTQTLIRSRKRTLPLSTTVQMCKNLIDSLEFFHKLDVVHGDICPENLLYLKDVTRNGVPSLVFFNWHCAGKLDDDEEVQRVYKLVQKNQRGQKRESWSAMTTLTGNFMKPQVLKKELFSNDIAALAGVIKYILKNSPISHHDLKLLEDYTRTSYNAFYDGVPLRLDDIRQVLEKFDLVRNPYYIEFAPLSPDTPPKSAGRKSPGRKSSRGSKRSSPGRKSSKGSKRSSPGRKSSKGSKRSSASGAI